MSGRVVIVGGGVAAHGAVGGMRRAGYEGEIVLVGREQEPPYQRPPLSKRYLIEPDMERRLLHLPPPDCELRLGMAVEELEPDQHRVLLADGERLEYDRLLLATGGRPRPLQGHERALHLRQVEDADRLREVFATGEPLTIVGAGFIGCEVAAAARARDVRVTVYEALPAPLERVLSPEFGRLLARVHREHGVDLWTGVSDLPELSGHVLVAVGSQPNEELAEAAGIACDRGILVDERGRTSAPDVYAAGDCARFFSPLFETRIRVEHFQTAQRHGAAVGRAMAGDEQPFAEAPWFWSDQYDLNIQYVGGALPWDRMLVRGDVDQPPFTAFYLAGDRLIAAAAVNDGRTITQTRRLMERRIEVDPAQLVDPSTDLKSLAAQRP
jgi:3-phenylpropionate/trans-cinnamate dioxygenase ferredoxin reductase component